MSTKPKQRFYVPDIQLPSSTYNVRPPLPTKEFFIIFCGPPNKGKSSAAFATLIQSPVNGGYAGVFDHVYVVSRSLATLHPFVLASIPPERKAGALSPEVLHMIIEEESQTGNDSLLFCDDVAVDANSMRYFPAFLDLIARRRHVTADQLNAVKGALNMIMTTQKWQLLPTLARDTATHYVMYDHGSDLANAELLHTITGMPTREWKAKLEENPLFNEEHDFLFVSRSPLVIYRNGQVDDVVFRRFPSKE